MFLETKSLRIPSVYFLCKYLIYYQQVYLSDVSPRQVNSKYLWKKKKKSTIWMKYSMASPEFLCTLYLLHCCHPTMCTLFVFVFFLVIGFLLTATSEKTVSSGSCLFCQWIIKEVLLAGHFPLFHDLGFWLFATLCYLQSVFYTYIYTHIHTHTYKICIHIHIVYFIHIYIHTKDILQITQTSKKPK